MKTAQEIADKYPEDQMVQAMIEYGNEVLDMCVTMAMAVDITNTTAHIQGKSPDAIWRELFKLKSEIK